MAAPRAVRADGNISAVVFDVGHVLYDWDIRYLYAKLIPDGERLDWFLSHVVTQQWHHQHDEGRPFVETGPELIAQFPEERALIEIYGPRWLETIGPPIPGMIELATSLADQGIPLFGITNFSDEFWRMFRPTAPVFGRFQNIIVSGTEKLVKPDPEIYRLAIRRFAIDPARSLFIDNRLENVEAARAEGFLGHHFLNREILAIELRKLGVSL
ncbi:MAG: HAD family phosphatase [Pacificimonas sp.]